MKRNIVKYFTLERSKLNSKKFGKITKIIFPDKSKIYISKYGWTLVASDKSFRKNIQKANKWKKIELLIPYSEINIAIRESIFAGYKLKSNLLSKTKNKNKKEVKKWKFKQAKKVEKDLKNHV